MSVANPFAPGHGQLLLPFAEIPVYVDPSLLAAATRPVGALTEVDTAAKFAGRAWVAVLPVAITGAFVETAPGGSVVGGLTTAAAAVAGNPRAATAPIAIASRAARGAKALPRVIGCSTHNI